MLPRVSVATPIAVSPSAPVEPKRFDHRGVPVGEYLTMNRSELPAETRLPVPKFNVPLNLPTTIMLPEGSNAICEPASLPAPPLRNESWWMPPQGAQLPP